MEEWDDEELTRVFTQLRAVTDAYEAVAVGGMEIALEATPTAPSVNNDRPPMPGDWHPYYEPHRQWLTHWLDNETTFDTRLPIPPPMRSIFDPGPDPIELRIPRVNVLRRRRAVGRAYVGGPVVCTYWTAVDDHGRWIASRKVTTL